MNTKLLSSLCLPALAITSLKAANEKPNILFIFADDQCFESLYSQHEYDKDIETPNLDKLMARGVSFTQAHNQGGWSPGVSVASRTMLNTGQYLWRAAQTNNRAQTGRTDPNSPKVMPEYTVAVKPVPKLWSQYMREAGYETYMAGKWHLTTKAQKVFDHTGTVRGGMPKQHPACYARKFNGKTEDAWKPYDPQYGGFWAGGTHWSEVLRDEAVGFLNHSKTVDKPFFMYVAFNSAHDPRQSPKEYVDAYPAEDIAVPKNFTPGYPYATEIGTGSYLRDEKLAPFPRNKRSVQVNRQEYYAIIAHMDKQIGEILNTLEATGQDKNTYIFFTADHGIAIGDHGFMGKQNMYEKSVRVPLIVCGPNVPSGKKIDEYVYLQDVMPSVLELAGVEKPEHVDYHSLMPMATGKTKKSAYEYIYGSYIGVQRMVKGDGYKMIIYPTAKVIRLYDLKKDPLEMKDLATRKNKAIMTKLFAKLRELQIRVEDPLDMTPYFNEIMEKL
ncbi:MAG: sulfatase-like hydrolase/transferase [Rikenellaceae bacterium]